MTTRVSPGATIGILGDGQLGQMIAIAAAELGYRTRIYGQAADAPAMRVSSSNVVGAWDDTSALTEFARGCDVVTLEFENVPVQAVRLVNEIAAVRPGAKLLEVAQHRAREKEACRAAKIETADFVVVKDALELEEGVGDLGGDVVIKTCQFGYDGKGQARPSAQEAFGAKSAKKVWRDLIGDAAVSSSSGEPTLIIEKRIAFSCEISVVAARSVTGEIEIFPCARNHHEEGILRVSEVPAGVTPRVEARTQEIATRLLIALDVIGLLAIEFFVVGDPRDDDAVLLVNEMAPRPHNSGHWTQDGCTTSQFAQLVRAVCGLPLGNTQALFPMRMRNIIGDAVNALEQDWKDPRASVHLYGKNEVRPGRKMGHVNTRIVDEGEREA